MPSETSEAMTFEQALERLEQIARQLEQGALPLEEALQLVEEGLQLQRRCRQLLEETEGRFRRLVEGAGGEVEAVEEPFPHGQDDGD